MVREKLLVLRGLSQLVVGTNCHLLAPIDKSIPSTFFSVLTKHPVHILLLCFAIYDFLVRYAYEQMVNALSSPRLDTSISATRRGVSSSSTLSSAIYPSPSSLS